MPLRITESQLEPESARTESEHAPATEHAAVGSLIARAGQALQGGNTAEYLRIVDETDQIESEHLRYLGRKLLLEQVLVLTRHVNDRQATAFFLALAHAAVAVLEKNPSEPLLLNYGGIAFYELWGLEGARALFTAAQRLDPNLTHVDLNLKAIKQRGRSTGPRNTALHPAMRALTARAIRVAHRAKPAEGMRMSLCMIVRDEEEMLPRCLEAVAPAVDEIIIVDTGSTDRTIEIAKSFNATVIEREWTGSFSEARNVGIDAATGDWILYLDADEVLVKEDVDRLKALKGQIWREAIYLQETNFTGNISAGTAVQHTALRLFRNRPEYRFKGRIHEQFAYALPGELPERIAESTVRIEHYGYLGVVREAKDKSRRNLEILQAQMQESPPDAFLHFNLGAEYSALDDYASALREYEESWRLVDALENPKLEFLPSLATRTISALRSVGRAEDAIKRADVLLERFPGFTDLVYHQGLAAQDLGRSEDAAFYLERAISMGDGPSRYTALVGAGTFLPRLVLAAMYINLRQAEKALPLVEWCADHHPDFFAVLEPYALALLHTGKSGTETVAAVRERFGTLSRTQSFMLGTALYERGFAAEAEEQFRDVLSAQPHSGPARAALVESLLYQRRYAEAAEEARKVPVDDPIAATVVRSELFARLLARDLETVPETLERARLTSLAPHDVSLYSAWLAQLRGDRSVGPVPPPAVPLLELMLESLLRVHDFDNFELLTTLYAQAPLSERERRERLAQMYLRRGFIKSAAREWLAVCNDQPDIHALTGLAHVALASGQPTNAHVFATQALALDPTNETLQLLVKTTSEANGA